VCTRVELSCMSWGGAWEVRLTSLPSPFFRAKSWGLMLHRCAPRAKQPFRSSSCSQLFFSLTTPLSVSLPHSLSLTTLDPPLSQNNPPPPLSLSLSLSPSPSPPLILSLSLSLSLSLPV